MNRLSVREFAELSIMSALLFVGKEVVRWIPNVHPVMLLIMLCVIWYGWKTMYPVAVFVVLEISVYGLGFWSVNYLYVWPLAVAVCMAFRKCRKWWIWAMAAGGFGFAFGALCAIPYIFTSGIDAAFAYWLAGISFDLVQGISNFFIVLILLPLLNRLMGKIKSNELKLNEKIR